MSKLKLEHVYKVYPKTSKKEKDVLAVEDFNLEIKEKEFIVFVGPSGCGKSTTLRMIAGLEENTKGNIYIDDELMNHVEPKYRNIAMVFQNYALYPHMTARENMSFGLKNIKVPTPLLDKEGNPIKGIDNKLLKNIDSENKRNEKSIKRIEKHLQQIESLKKELETLKENEEGNQKKIVKVSNKIEELNNRYDEKTLQTYIEKREKIKEDKEYFSTHEIPLYKEKHLPKEEIKKRVLEAAKTLDIEELLDRKPKNMSGGQRQRVALGRAIVRDPKIFLLDEPLSNLDAKLRTQMRVEIINLYNKLNTPFIYVTHDQVEAMSMGTRIVVMRKGVIQQVDTPTNLYDYPKNRFVAGFLGTPQMNFLEVNIKKDKSDLLIKLDDKDDIKVPLKEMRKPEEEFLDGNEHQVILGIRPEHIHIDKKGLPFQVDLIEPLGSETLVYLSKKNNNQVKLVLKTNERVSYNRGDSLNIIIDKAKIHLFRDDGIENSILS